MAIIRELDERILDFFQPVVAFHRPLAVVAGNALSGLFLSQALYWSQRTGDPDGWFYKTQEEWSYELCMTRYEQETARRKLKTAKLLEEKRQGIPAKLYFRISVENLVEALRKASNDGDLIQYAGIPHTRMGKSPILERGNPASFHIETSPKTTTERKKERARDIKGARQDEEDLARGRRYLTPGSEAWEASS